MAPEIAVVIPAWNEEDSIGKVVAAIPRDVVHTVVVVNNGSTDRTESVAGAAGAVVLTEERRGYGNACLKGIAWLKENKPPDILVFLDGDFSDHPEEIPLLLKPILQDGADLVIGSRVLGKREKGSLTPQQIMGNALATTLIRWIYGTNFTDLGPFRAITFKRLLQLDMQDPTYGWTVEMQVKAAKRKWKCAEVAASYRRRIGVSKVSGTVKGTVFAGVKILWTIFRLMFRER